MIFSSTFQYMTRMLPLGHIDTVELLANAMKRITQLENTLFSHDSEGESVRDDNDEPVISSKLTKAPEKPIEEETDKTPIIGVVPA